MGELVGDARQLSPSAQEALRLTSKPLTAHDPKDLGEPDPVPGLHHAQATKPARPLGTDSWKAAQRFFHALHYDAGTVDGIAGPGTKAAFAAFANLLSSVC
ncbi:hypothetical protein OG946_24745 [Streptomyces sp. NBC_01808]|uniref:hypothetical protein n=1 Tax=Streptomyces sp. NBC_01808 TaxID=2975947 RepID=UPI002DD9FB7C|nr:hypothetical protein [Streptomyces sp. NBC_01808]WSA40291.1 hypothetical protein OG946_24745 [Streptomyces sp. NBC_01808]